MKCRVIREKKDVMVGTDRKGSPGRRGTGVTRALSVLRALRSKPLALTLKLYLLQGLAGPRGPGGGKGDTGAAGSSGMPGIPGEPGVAGMKVC